MKARVHISLKPGVLDPQGKAIGNCLEGGSAFPMSAKSGKAS